MTDKDTRKINVSLASLENETTYSEPFVVGISGGKTITFPAPDQMEWDEAERFMQSLEGQSPSQILESWLSEEDFAAFKAEKISLRTLNALLEQVTIHYSDIFGTAPKD